MYIHACSYDCFSGKRKENESKKKMNEKKETLYSCWLKRLCSVLLQSLVLPSVFSVCVHRVLTNNLFSSFMLFYKFQNGIENLVSFRLIV